MNDERADPSVGEPTHIVLLDRDGTLCEERHHLVDPELVRLLPNAAKGVRAMRAQGLKVVLVTNQSVVGRGLTTPEGVAAVHARLLQLLQAEGADLDGIYYCPHRPDDDCDCRKPRPGLAYRAAQDAGSDLSSGFVVGDNVCDLQLARRVGATSILVRTGYGCRVEAQHLDMADVCVNDLSDAAAAIAARCQWVDRGGGASLD